jgi:excisionase family DNA binding protein
MVKEGEGITKEVLTAEDLARYLGFNRNWIYRQAEAGELPGVKLGKSWRFKRSVIDRWLEERIERESQRFAGPKAKAEAGLGLEVQPEAKKRAHAHVPTSTQREARVEVELEELPPEAAELLERVFKVIKSHPRGVTLPKIGEELGVEWRRLTSFVNRLVEEGRVKRSGPPGRMYFPVE